MMIIGRFKMQHDGGWVSRCPLCKHEEYCGTMAAALESFTHHAREIHGNVDAPGNEEWPDVIYEVK